MTTMRDPRLHPKPGDELRNPETGATRRVLVVVSLTANPSRFTVKYSLRAKGSRSDTKHQAFQSEWTAWCERYNVEVVRLAA